MAVGVSLQLPPHEFGGLRKDGGRTNQFKISEMKSWRHLHLPSVCLSSRGLREDIWSLHVTDRIYKLLHCVPCRYSLFTCRCSILPSFSDGIPLLKHTTLALSRSCNVLKESLLVSRSYTALKESPLVMQLAPAIGVIAFAVWGLGPLMRYSRQMFLRRNDNNWKKSKTHHVFTSYLQPLLLWTGTTLVCRALDPVVFPSSASQTVKQRLLNFVQSLSTVLAFAYCLMSLIQQTQKFFVEKSSSDDTRNMGFQFAAKAVYSAVWIAAFSLFMELLGFSTQKWVTAGGLGTVLLTLAGREIFTNFLSSIMIHATRPFVLNEWIQTKIEGYEVSGTVEHVGWWSPTIIRGDDREAVHIPNHKFTVNVVRNLSQKTHWRIKTHLAISHLDANKISVTKKSYMPDRLNLFLHDFYSMIIQICIYFSGQNIVADMRKVLAKSPQIEQQRLHRRVFLENINPENQALLILISCFVKTSRFEEYLFVKEAVLLDLLSLISHHRARLATPIRTMQKVYSDADMDNIPFSDTIITRAGTAINSPLLLIEPPQRINGDDKAKLRTTPRSNEEQATKNAAASEPKPIIVTDDTVQKNTAASEPKPTTETGEAVENSSEKQQQKKTSLGELRSKSGKGGSPPRSSSNPPSKSPPLAGSGNEQVEVVVPPTVKNESEKSAPSPSAVRPVFESNIVLGVALEGSKRTLPIEEVIPPTPPPVEKNKTAASRSGNGSSPSSVKDRKGQTPAGDQSDQKR